MSTSSAPFGLAPAFHPSGTIRPTIFSIATGYATGILTNQIVKLHTDGTIQAAAINDRFIGTFQGVSYTNTNGARVFSPQWTASTAGTDIQATVTLDPAIVYDIQANGTMAVTTIGAQYDTTAVNAGSTTTGLSALMLDTATGAANAGLQVVGLTPGPDNAWGDTYTIVQVRISEHQFVADVAAF